MFINGTPSSPAARQALRLAKNRSAGLPGNRVKRSHLSPSQQLDAADQRESGGPALRTCEDAYVDYCRRTNVQNIPDDGTICGPEREDLRLRNVLQPKRASLQCTRCGSSHTRHVSWSSKDDPHASYTKCLDCASTADENDDSIGPFSIYEGRPRFELRTWFPYTDKEKAVLNSAKQQSRSLTATPTKRASTTSTPSGAHSSGEPDTPGRASRVSSGTRAAAGGKGASNSVIATPPHAPLASASVTRTSIEEIRNKPVNAMTDDEVFDLVTDYLLREGLIVTASPWPAPSVESPAMPTLSQPPSLTSPASSAPPSTSRARNTASTAAGSSTRAPPEHTASTSRSTTSASTAAVPSTSHEPSKQRAPLEQAAPVARFDLSPSRTSRRRKVTIMVELVNRSYYRNPVTITNNRITWDDIKALSTLRYVFIFPQYGLDVFDSRLQHWRQLGITTTIPVLPQQNTVFARIVYSRALSLQEPIVIWSDSEEERQPAALAGAANARNVVTRQRAQTPVINITSSSESEQPSPSPPTGRATRKRARIPTREASRATPKRRKVSLV